MTILDNHVRDASKHAGTVEVYVKGRCRPGESGCGKWQALVNENGNTRVLEGEEVGTTHPRMTMRAAIEALKGFPHQRHVIVYCKLEYLVRGMAAKRWIEWQLDGWRTSSREPVKNKDLWQELVSVSEGHEVEWAKW